MSNPRQVSWNDQYIRALGEVVLDDKNIGSNAYAAAMLKRFPDKDFSRNSIGRALRSYKSRITELFPEHEANKIFAKFFTKDLAGKSKEQKAARARAKTLKQKSYPPKRPAVKKETPKAPESKKEETQLTPLAGMDGKLIRSALDLSSSMCRYGFGDPGSPDFAFCARATSRGPYCEDHARLMYQPSSEKKKKTTV